MNENVNVCITPKGDKPVLHFSQFDNERVFTVTVLADDGETAAVLTGLDIEFRLRKTDSHVVTIAPESVVSNVITFMTTEQLCACCGQNIASVVIMNNDSVISTLDILVDIQRDILSGGLTSESDIRNLTTQIEQIVPEVVSEDYYNKTEVDALIAEHTFDPTNYYDKTDVDGLLADKADISDLPDMSDYYTKSEADTLLLDKADKSDVYTKAQTDSLLFFQVDKINEKTAGGLPAALVSFNDAGNDCPLSELTVGVASGSSSVKVTRCGTNIVDFLGNLRSSDSGFTISSTSDGAIHYSGVASNAYAQLTYAINLPLKAGTILTFSRDQAVAYQHYFTLKYTDNSADYARITADTTSVSFTLVKDLKTIDVVCLGLTVGASYDDTIKFWVNIGSAESFAKYNGKIETISIGSTISQNGVLDVISGLLILEDESTIQCTGVEIDTATGLNYVYCDTGNIITLKYFGFNAEDLFRYIRLIKG